METRSFCGATASYECQNLTFGNTKDMKFSNPHSRRESIGSTDRGSAATCAVIEVSPVSPAETALPETAYKCAVESLLKRPPKSAPLTEDGPHTGPRVEACTQYHGRLVANVHYHPVVAATHLAFEDHRPLTLSPDILWLLVAQGFANHVNAHAEELRSTFVNHSDKLQITVDRDDFIKGSPENDWAGVFGEFSQQIREHLGATTHDLLLPNFSTTDRAERAAAQVVLLDAMQSYFTYEVRTRCGIPQIRLEGTVDDWGQLAERVRGLARFGLEWWTGALGPIVDQFVMASEGVIEQEFWQSMYKLNSFSGAPYTSGWLHSFFPYLHDARTGHASRENAYLTEGGGNLQDFGPTLNDFPSGLARAPFKWNAFSMEFLGGFVGVRQDPNTLALKPEIGWAIREVA